MRPRVNNDATMILKQLNCPLFTVTKLLSFTHGHQKSPREVLVIFACLFDLILYVPSAIFQLYRDGSSWVEPVLS